MQAQRHLIADAEPRAAHADLLAAGEHPGARRGRAAAAGGAGEPARGHRRGARRADGAGRRRRRAGARRHARGLGRRRAPGRGRSQRPSSARARRRRRARASSRACEPTVVSGQADRIGRAVSNLIDNARKWSPAGRRSRSRLSDGVLSVRDHGPGFQEADLPFVFDRFYRAERRAQAPRLGARPGDRAPGRRGVRRLRRGAQRPRRRRAAARRLRARCRASAARPRVVPRAA